MNSLPRRPHASLFLALMLPVVAGCAGLDSSDSSTEEVQNIAEAHKNKPPTGEELFEEGTFGGNGRSCGTCHSEKTGTVSVADAQKRFAKDPNDPLFRS